MSHKEWQQKLKRDRRALEAVQNGVCPVCLGHRKQLVYIGCDCVRSEPYEKVHCSVCRGTGALVCQRPGEKPMRPQVKISEAMANAIVNAEEKRDGAETYWTLPPTGKSTTAALDRRGMLTSHIFRRDGYHLVLTPKALAVRQGIIDRKQKITCDRSKRIRRK